jgi:phosphomethylpyrimidine synthase
MKITQEVREFAREHRLAEQEALAEGLREKADEFTGSGAEIYREV